MKYLEEKRKKHFSYLIIAIMFGMGIPSIASAFAADWFFFNYYLSSLLYLFLMLYLLKQDMVRLTIGLVVLFVNASIVILSMIYGYFNCFDLYFFPTLIGIIYIASPEKKLFIICLFGTIICWAWLVRYGYSNLGGNDIIKSFYTMRPYRIYNLIGSAVIMLTFGWLLLTYQNQYDEKLERKKEELQAALDFKTKLLKELHHRIKNNLNMVGDLLFIKSKATNEQAFLDFTRETKNRILSISKIHEQLLQMEEFEEVSIKGYLEELINAIVSSYAKNPKNYTIQLYIQDFKLGMDKSVTLGLMVNEIISNIIKHAYSTDESGIIRCNIHVEHDEMIAMEIGDYGKGMDQEKSISNESIGIKLLSALVQSLDGTIEIKNEIGFMYYIRFPRMESRKTQLV